MQTQPRNTSDTVKAKILEQHFAHSASDIRHQK